MSTTPTVWATEATHNVEDCGSCREAASAAISLATSTGSTGATYSDGLHVAKVSRDVEVERLAYLEALSSTYGTPIETLLADDSRDRRGGYEGPGGYGR